MTAYALHPGRVRAELNQFKNISRFLPYVLWLLYPILCVFTKSPFEGAQTAIEVSVTDEVLNYSGGYFRWSKVFVKVIFLI